MDQWEGEQAKFFATLGKEPEGDTLRVEYIELLQALQATRNEKTKADSSFYNSAQDGITFVTETPSSTAASYAKAASATWHLECKRRLAWEWYDNILNDVVDLEVRLGIDRRWISGDSDYIEALKYIAECRYHRALDKVHQLVIQRLFELYKMNLASTGKSFLTSLRLYNA